jgi:UDP-N-acetylmuramoyl-tripeptide--D-alanyl-D-alanine ligase
MTPASWGPQRPDTALRLPVWIRGGAVAAVVQNQQLGTLPRLPRGFPVLLVRDTRRALSGLAQAARDRFRGTVIALTGTVGKTTTREMLRHVLDEQGGAVASLANNNNIPGAERTLASTPAEHGWCIAELGFGQPRDGIATSSRRLRPHVALVTTVSEAHLDVFSAAELADHRGAELVCEAKADVFAGLVDGGRAVLGCDHPWFPRLRERARERGVEVIAFGDDPQADCRLVSWRATSTGSVAECDVAGRAVQVELSPPGRHMAINALGVLATVHAGQADVGRAAAALSSFEAVAGRARVERVSVGGRTITLVDDSFNATPASVRSSLALLALVAPEGGRRIAVLGDILHLGPESPALHEALAEEVERHGVDRVLTTGAMMARLARKLPAAVCGPHCEALADLYAALMGELSDGDVVTLKASTPVGLSRLANALRAGRPHL